MQRAVFIAICHTLLAWGACQLPAIEYLPRDVEYDPAIPSPESYFGFPIGRRHLEHHQLVGYMGQLAKLSDRVTLREYGRTYGQRSLIVLTITSPQNHARLDTVRRQHVQLADPARSADVPLESLPAVVSMGYSVHGNEASAANAAPLVAYHLAAGRGEAIDALLRETIVLLDPCLNPDGFQRFALWVNSHRGKVPNGDANDREHNEAWPRGRTNYYWFDLNRDWLPAQHPESKGRLRVYRKWLPNLVLDFHEMSSKSTFFFQPGVPQRRHPLIPKTNDQLTRQIAQFHARILDKNGSLYFTEEVFDDFYLGKGSTYPDLHGGIGILFEQASVRGQVQQTDNGNLTFPFAIKNQFLASLSSLEAAQALRLPLLEYKRDFYRESLVLAKHAAVEAYIVSAPGDPVRLHRFLELLLRHGIDVFQLDEDLVVNGTSFGKGKALVIPTAQAEFRYVTSLFERRTTFPEGVFYDVSAWTLPLAFGLRYVELADLLPTRLLGEPAVPEAKAKSPFTTDASDIAYVIDWRSYFAPRTLYRLLRAGLRVKVAQRPFAIQTGGQLRQFGYGTLLVHLGIQDHEASRVRQLMHTAVEKDQVSVYPAKSGLTAQGIDFGSNAFSSLSKPKVLLVTGEGVSGYEAGEVWHLLDQRFAMPVTMVDTMRLGQTPLRDYTSVVLVSGSYSQVSRTAIEHLKQWLNDGGNLIAIGTAIHWLNKSNIVAVEFREASKSLPEDQPVNRRPYAEARRDAAEQLVRGAIVNTEIDVTHPICYGYEEGELAVFRNNRVFLQPTTGPYANPVVYTPQPLLGGYLSAENLKRLEGTASVVVKRQGRGRAILMADNPNFRAFWYGTNRLFFNSIFFGPLVR